MEIKILKTNSSTGEMVTSIMEDKEQKLIPIEIRLVHNKIMPDEDMGSVLVDESNTHLTLGIKARITKSSDVIESIIQYNMTEILNSIKDDMKDKTLTIIISYHDFNDEEDMYKFIYASKLAVNNNSNNITDVSIIITDYEV